MDISRTETELELQSGFKIFVKICERRKAGNSLQNQKILVVVHGGPGVCDESQVSPHLLPLFEKCPNLSSIISYDQLGCGKSEKPNSYECYSLCSYVNELAEVVEFARQKYPQNEVYIFGHSWGGQLVSELLCRESLVQIKAAIVSNAPFDETSYEARQKEIRDAMDEDLRAFHESQDLDLMNDDSVESLVFRTLIGKSDSEITGTMVGWSLINPSRLHLLNRYDTLFIAGEYDTINVQEMVSSVALMNRATALVIPQCEHCPFFGEAASMFFDAIHDLLEL